VSVAAPAGISLSDVNESDLPIFFGHETEPDDIPMADFTPKDPFDRDALDEVAEKPHGLMRSIDRGLAKQAVSEEGSRDGSEGDQ